MHATRTLGVVLALVLIASGCASIGLGREDDPATNGQVRGVVLEMDARGERLELDTEGGEIVSITVSERTPVTYQGRDYQPANLERGDLVVVQLREGIAGGLIADRIEVERSVQERRGTNGQTGTGPMQTDELQGEVIEVDARDREIQVRTDRGAVWVQYREGTPVYFQGQRYEIRNLDPGDVVRIRLDRTPGGLPVARSIEVEQPVQERGRDGRTGTASRTYSGTVDWVDDRQGAFGLRTTMGETVQVVIPFNAQSDLRRDFERLRRGDRVEFVGFEVDRGRIQVERFR
jgi:cold shock CspA family protein